MELRQRLSPLEEGELVEWLLQLYRWGWPARTRQLGQVVKELLLAKEDITELGGNWQQGFLRRWPELKSKFVKP